MSQHTIRLHPLGKELIVNHQTPLIDVLHEFGVEFPCGGKGTCGKCKVRLLDGRIEISEIHRQKLEQLNLPHDWRLACYSHCTSNITLEIAQLRHLILAHTSDFDSTPQPRPPAAVQVEEYLPHDRFPGLFVPCPVLVRVLTPGKASRHSVTEGFITLHTF